MTVSQVRRVTAAVVAAALVFCHPVDSVAQDDNRDDQKKSESPVTQAPLTPPETRREERCPRSVAATDDQLAQAVARTKTLATVHALATGKNVTVAVIDTGVNNHPKLPNLLAAGDLVDPQGDTSDAFTDCDGHGTIVAGVIAARDLGDGISGVAPDARIVSIKQTSAAHETGRGGTLTSLAEGIYHALDAGAQIINISVVSCISMADRARVSHEALDGAISAAEERGAVIVAAAGNLGGPCTPAATIFPANYPTVIPVAALAPGGRIAPYSVPRLRPFLSGPGWVPAGLSPDGMGLAGGLAGDGGTVFFTGTSFAAPWVSGVAALVKERYPDDPPARLRARLVNAADPVTGAVDPYQALTFMPATYRRAMHMPIIAQPSATDNRPRNRALSALAVVITIVCAAIIIGFILVGQPPVGAFRATRTKKRRKQQKQ